MMLPSAISKGSRDWGKPRHCWLPLLPAELRIELLLTIGAQHNAIDSVMVLARDFPEFGQLVLVLHWTHGSILDVADTAIEVVSLNDYAISLKKVSNDRPVKILIEDFSDPHKHQLPSHKLDGSSSCLLNRFVDSHTMVELQTQSEHSSLSLFNQTPVPLVKCVVESNQSSSSTLSLDYKDLKSHKRWCPGETFEAGRSFSFTPTLNEKITLFDETHWRLNSSTRLKSFMAYNCSDIFNISLGHGVEVVEIRMGSREDVPIIALWNYPTHVLHVTFDLCCIPLTMCAEQSRGNWHYSHWSKVADFFTLQNQNWSQTNPYGLTVHVPESNLGFPVGETDQATFNEMFARIFPSNWLYQLPLWYYKTVKLYGVPDSNLVRSSFDNVVCLYWWRLTPRAVDTEDDRPTPIIRCPSLTELHIISVIKKKERRPLFQAQKLRKLVLISLHDSDVPWSLDNTLSGDAPDLQIVYLERRTDPSRDPAPPMAIGSSELRMVASTVDQLHIRGYVPDVFMIGVNESRYIFKQLRTLMLDVSEIPRRPNKTRGKERE